MEEIAKETGYTEEQIIEALEGAQAYGTFSLDKTFDDIGEDGESSFLEKYTGFDEKGYERVENSEIINKVVSELSDQYRYIFKERFFYKPISGRNRQDPRRIADDCFPCRAKHHQQISGRA